MWTDDPVADFERYDAEQESVLKKCPMCSVCYEYIQGEFAYFINDEWICEECIEDLRREVTVDD